MKPFRYALFSCLWFIGLVLAVRADELPRRLRKRSASPVPSWRRARAAIKEAVDKRQTAGVVTLVARRGKVVAFDATGLMDIDAGKPMQTDTIFRIYSMSKPITTVAAAILWEEGRFQLDDPVSKYLPEFKHLQVFAGNGKDPCP